MTTTYTTPFETGDLSLRAFALRCARDLPLLRACNTVRALPPDATLPAVIQPDPSFLAQETAARTEAESFAAMTTEEAEGMEEDCYRRDRARFDAELDKATSMNARLRAMEAKILAWVPGEEFEYLRDFMLEQVRGSIIDLRPIEAMRPRRTAPSTWRAEQQHAAEESVDFFQKKRVEQETLAKRATDWLNRLRAALPKTA